MGLTFEFSKWFILDSLPLYRNQRLEIELMTKVAQYRLWNYNYGKDAFWLLWGTGEVWRQGTKIKTFYFAFDFSIQGYGKANNEWHDWVEFIINFDFGQDTYQLLQNDIVYMNMKALGRLTWNVEENITLESGYGYDFTKNYVLRVNLDNFIEV